MLANPAEDLGEAELAPLHRSGDEFVSSLPIDIEKEAISSQEYVCGGEGDPLVPIDEPVVVGERFQQGGGFHFESE